MAHEQLWTLRDRIDEAKSILPLPELLEILGYGHLTLRNPVRCPFHDDKSPSFSVFQGRNGIWLWKCHAGCGHGDEIAFIRMLHGSSNSEAINTFLSMAEERGAVWLR